MIANPSAKAFRDRYFAKLEAASEQSLFTNPDEAGIAVSIADCCAETHTDTIARLEELAKQSRGPHTAAGKMASSANAVKHGLSGAGKFLPPALRAEVDRLEVAFRAEFLPEGEFEERAVRDLALASARKERCFALEAELLETRRLRDLATFEIDRKLAAERLGARLPEAPVPTVLELRRTAAGRDWLITQWGLLREGVHPDKCYWVASDVHRLLCLQGVSRDQWHLDLKTRMIQSLVAQAHEADPDRVALACRGLGAFLATAIAELERDRPGLVALEERERDLLESDLRFDASPEVEKLRRLGRDADRLYQRSLRDLRLRDRTADRAGNQTPNEPGAAATGCPQPVLSDDASISETAEGSPPNLETITAQNEMPEPDAANDLPDALSSPLPVIAETHDADTSCRQPVAPTRIHGRHRKAPKRLFKEREEKALAQAFPADCAA